MRIRNVLQEFEAKLEPNPVGSFSNARGKAEWKTYENGSRQCKVSVSKLNLPDGIVLELILDDRRIAKVTVQGGMARYKQESEAGEIVPAVMLNQVLQIIHNDSVILEGQFYSE
jgi:hypothetical protein